MSQDAPRMSWKERRHRRSQMSADIHMASKAGRIDSNAVRLIAGRYNVNPSYVRAVANEEGIRFRTVSEAPKLTFNPDQILCLDRCLQTIAEARDNPGLSVEELSARMNYSPPRICEILKMGRRHGFLPEKKP